MSDLQLSLLGVGGLAIVAVFIYNRWQVLRARRAASEAFSSNHPDALMPGADQPRKPVRPEAVDRAAREAVAEGAGKEQVPQVPQLPEAHSTSPQVDYAIEVDLPEPVSGARILEIWSSASSGLGSRARLWRDGDTGLLPLTAGDACTRIVCAIQLVDRSGVVGESELIAFRSSAETLATRLGVSVRAPEMRDALDRAREIDSVCAEADIQIVMHLTVPNGRPFPAERLRQLSIEAGLVASGEEVLTYRDASGAELFSLAADPAGRGAWVNATGASLAMDVPRTPDVEASYALMARVGKSLAEGIQGSLSDDNGRLLDDAALQAIARQVTAVRTALEGHGIVPGAPLALRLFS